MEINVVPNSASDAVRWPGDFCAPVRAENGAEVPRRHSFVRRLNLTGPTSTELRACFQPAMPLRQD
jgi:hypothetical protein